MPRDSWLVERSDFQPGPAFAESTDASVRSINEAIVQASSPHDLFLRLEKASHLLRVTDKVWPTMYRCATVSTPELEQVRTVEIIRQGRVIHVTKDKVTLEHGSFEPLPDTLYVDCTADALAKLKPAPVFAGREIKLQTVRHCQQVFSAAFIAHVEATYDSDDFKNDLCRVIPHPDEEIDCMITTYQSHKNDMRWAKQPKTAAWLSKARLDWFGRLPPQPPADPTQAAEYRAALEVRVNSLCEKLEQLVGQLPEKDATRAMAQIEKFR